MSDAPLPFATVDPEWDGDGRSVSYLNNPVRVLAIVEITPDGVRTAAAFHPADVLVWGTGFHASTFLHLMRVRGRDGADLHEVLAAGVEPRAAGTPAPAGG